MYKFLATALMVFTCLFAHPASADAISITIENDGWILKGDRYDAAGDAPRAVALLFHNAGGNRTEYAAFAGELARNSITSIAVDLRGHGESTNLDTFDWKVRKNFEINVEAWKDIVAAMSYVDSDPTLSLLPLIFVGASYSGEKMVEAATRYRMPNMMIEFSPGSFSDTSIAQIDPSGIPWLFVRAEKELPFFDALFEAIRAGSDNAEIWIVPGKGHGTRILDTRPRLLGRIVSWINEKLKTIKE